MLGTAVLTVLFLPRTRWWDTGLDLLSAAAYVVNWRMASGATDYHRVRGRKSTVSTAVPSSAARAAGRRRLARRA